MALLTILLYIQSTEQSRLHSISSVRYIYTKEETIKWIYWCCSCYM